MAEASQPKYILGHEQSEIERLILQSALLRPFTERLFKAAGMRTGMRVLDLGCGPGDVSMLAANLVGSSGSVVGIDRSSDVISVAKRRAGQAGFTHVSFERVAVEHFGDVAAFDCVVGRFVLIYQSDPIEFLRTAARFVRPGGVMALHELDLAGDFTSCPPVWAWNTLGSMTMGAFREALPHYGSANQMIKWFAEAGLPLPELFREIPVGDAEQSLLYAWLERTLRSVWPQLVEMGVATAEGFPTDRTMEGVRTALVQARSQIEGPAQVCAWVKI
jgi:ubiquinone/menaquinone biosynthesis C-methylase UbiE